MADDSPRHRQRLARDAFVWGYATVDLYRILHNFALDRSSPEFKAPVGSFAHARGLATAADTTVVAMNVDTPYSYAWLDLRAEPMVLTVPGFEASRYVSAELIDLYTYIVGYVSPRTNGHRGGRFVVAGPSWSGDVPDGIDGVFRSPTELLLILVRVQLFGPEDLSRVHALQDGFAVSPLSSFSNVPSPGALPVLQPVAPVDVRADLDVRFFEVLDWMLHLMPVLDEDRSLRDELADGVLARADSDDAVLREVLAGMNEGLELMVARARTVRSSAELFGSRAHFAGDSLARAVGAMLGILGNAAEEYLGVGYRGDADGEPFDGSSTYEITFEHGAEPPVGAFWSITLYDDRQLLYGNRLGRYCISSRDFEQIPAAPDGSRTILVSHAAPEGDTAGWLPCPAGRFTLAFRTYVPGDAIRDGRWTAPPVRRKGAAR
jgi:hypothetical protein